MLEVILAMLLIGWMSARLNKMWNGVLAYKNGNNYILHYGGDDVGWQWVPGYDHWAGDGPTLSDVPDAQAFVRTMHFKIAGDEV